MSGSGRAATSRRTSWVICLVKCFAGIGVQQTEIWWSDVLWVNDLLAWFFETGTAKTIKLFIGHYPGLGIKYFINLGWSILRGWVIFDTRMRMNRREYVSLTPEVLMMNLHWRSVSLSAEVAKFWRRQDERAASAKIREAGLREEVWGRRISFIIRTESGLTNVQPQAGVNTLQSHNAMANWHKIIHSIFHHKLFEQNIQSFCQTDRGQQLQQQGHARGGLRGEVNQPMITEPDNQDYLSVLRSQTKIQTQCSPMTMI